MQDNRNNAFNMHSLSLPTIAAMDRFGRALASIARSGDIIALSGEIGAGKTTLARAIITALCPQAGDIPSPTYTLVQAYPAKDFEILHADLYRLQNPDEADELGLADAAEALALIEWPERAPHLLHGPVLHVRLEVRAQGRTALLGGRGNWTARLNDLPQQW